MTGYLDMNIFTVYAYTYTYTGWGAQSWTFFARPGTVAVGGFEQKDYQKQMGGI
jgi:hypothetical protein